MILSNVLTFGKFSVSRKPIINGGVIRPVGLLFLIEIQFNENNHAKMWFYETQIINIFVKCIILLFFSPVCCTLQCYMGSVGVNGHSLVNTTCDHILSHNMPVMGDGHNVTHTQVNYR